ncbi:MAG: flagellar FliJ family protein [Planctomycetota bacterium]
MPLPPFQLETVRRVRQSRRDELRGELADEAARVEAELAATQQRLSADVRSPSFDVGRVLESQRYELLLKSQLSDLQKKGELVEQEVDRRRQAVVGAEQDVKALDLLEDRQRQRHTLQEARREQAEMDEIAGVLTTRRRGEEARRGTADSRKEG